MNSDKTIIMTGGKQMKCCDNCDDSKDMCHKCDEDFSEWRQKKMITQQELTDQCTPEIIKKMVELAEGFEITERQITVGNQLLISRGIKYNINSCETTKDFSEVMVKFSLFPLLIHRAVEGCSHIIVDYESKHVEETTMCKLYNFKDYQPTTLTHAGCAMLDCLLEVLK